VRASACVHACVHVHVLTGSAVLQCVFNCDGASWQQVLVPTATTTTPAPAARSPLPAAPRA
jgi:hypothetical protein